MKLIKHIIFTDVGSKKILMINALNGLIDKIDDHVYDVIKRWQNDEEIVPDSDYEKELYDTLLLRGYIVSDHNEELVMKEEILNKLRMAHTKAKNNVNHITFILTYDCNFRCAYCFEGVASIRENQDNVKSCSYLRKEVITPEQIDAAFNLE